MSIATVSQSPNPGETVFLFRLDASAIGGSVLFFCQGAIGGEPVVFGGQSYTPVDLEMTEFETNAGGVLPQPKLRFAIYNEAIQELINTFGDLVGAEIRRVRTFKRFLDGQPEADPSAYIGADVFRIERKADETPIYVEYELSAAIDQEGLLLPGRQVLRDVCIKRYRTYDPTNPAAAADGFVYATINPCPYTGAACFNELDVPTTANSDDCGRRLSSCKARFANQPLPFGGFPGAARARA